ncbi:MAG TPA: response regulator [Ktedonobacterales bacterium]|nr:response regulator [Ktedonobacterales bacterium]
MSKRILAIDDSDDTLTIVGFAFEHEGYQFAGVRSHAEMLAALAHELPDLIVVDLMLPGVNGYQAIEQLHADARTRSIPVIVITAKSEAIYRCISANMGAHHLVKPFHPDELVAQARAIFAETATVGQA